MMQISINVLHLGFPDAAFFRCIAQILPLKEFFCEVSNFAQKHQNFLIFNTFLLFVHRKLTDTSIAKYKLSVYNKHIFPKLHPKTADGWHGCSASAVSWKPHW